MEKDFIKNKKKYHSLQIHFSQFLVDDVLSISNGDNQDYDVEQDTIPFI